MELKSLDVSRRGAVTVQNHKGRDSENITLASAALPGDEVW